MARRIEELERPEVRTSVLHSLGGESEKLHGTPPTEARYWIAEPPESVREFHL